MDILVVLEDWYGRLLQDQSLGPLVQATCADIAQRFPQTRSYTFLPVLTTQVESSADLAYIRSLSAVASANPATSALTQAPDIYHRGLSALSAIRSQSAHQKWQWYGALGEGQKFPNEKWEGGIWPAAPYPDWDPVARRLTTASDTHLAVAAPVEISVLSLSLRPDFRLPVEPCDPMIEAIKAFNDTHCCIVAAGNSGVGGMSPWAIPEGNLAVGALGDHGDLLTSSSTGLADGTMRGPDVVASGLQGLAGQGTSFAAPRIAFLALVCSAIVGQFQSALLGAQGLERGPTSQALAVIDVPSQPITDTATSGSIIPSLDLAALPILGVRRDLLIDALQYGLKQINLKPMAGGLHWFQFPIENIYRWIRESATPVSGRQTWEVGAGHVTLEGLVQYLETLTVAEVVRSILGVAVDLPNSLGAQRILNPAELVDLANIVRVSRRLYVWDYENETFFVAPRINTAWVDLDDFIGYLPTSVDVEKGGHLAKVVQASFLA